MKQTTLRQAFEIAGVGLHTGRATRVRVLPAAAGDGYRLRRPGDAESVPLRPDRCDGTRHCDTFTFPDGGRAMVLEHLLAALAGLGVDNATLEIDGGEVPGADGSARDFARRIVEAGLIELEAEAVLFRPREPLAVADGDATVTLLPDAGGGLTLTYAIDYPDARLARGVASWRVDPATFPDEIAPARTFVLRKHADAMRAAGLGRGATTENTLVLDGDGVVDNTPRYADECARHKLLDLLGDLATAGVRLAGARVVSVRGGHGLNLRLADAIARAHRRASAGALMDINRIESILPHRYPFLLVDRVLEIDPRVHIVAVKNVTRNEPFFEGHFPRQPLMPGVLQLEALAQAAAVLFLGEPECRDKLAVIAAADHVKWRRPVVPGDQLLLDVTIEKFKTSMGVVRGRATVAGELATEAEIKFALIPDTRASRERA
jgi:UDP-3-O-[3-hydroxymyristoyl] N-acetylglucosamine deacetylase/3-hydroxyacyl-[acyl-carrier-protein] dehydratase